MVKAFLQKKPELVAMFGMVLTALTLIFTQVGFLSFVTLLPTFWGILHTEKKKKSAFRLGFLLHFCYDFVLYHWFLALYPLDFAGLTNVESVVVILIGWFGLSALQGLLGGFSMLVYFGLRDTMSAFKNVLLLSALWVLSEYAGTLTFAGVPWGRLCLSLSDYLPFLQSASLFGSYFVSFLIVFINGLLTLFFLQPKKWGTVALALVLFVSNFAYGLIRMDQEVTGETVTVASVQGNVASQVKWDMSFSEEKEAYEDLIRKASEEADLIVLSETAFPYIIEDGSKTDRFFSKLAKECNTAILVGAFEVREDGEQYNSLFLYRPDGTRSEQTYSKRHLVPFGEYVPAKSIISALIPLLASLSDFTDNLSAGEGAQLICYDDAILGGLICFDSLYEDLARESVSEGANLLVLSSNDSWFRQSVALEQHKNQGVLRAIENGRYLVRSGSTGITCIVNQYGENLSELETDTAGYATAQVTLSSSFTLYTCIGNLFVLLCGVYIVLIAIKKCRRTGT